MNTKRTILFFVCAIFAALFCASCFSSWDGDGLAEVRIGPAGGNARTVRPGESELAGMLVKVTFSGHGKAIEKTFGSEGGKVRLTAGTWQLLSKAYIGGRLRGIADETVSLKPGSSHTIVLDTCIGIKNQNDFYDALGNGINGIGHDREKGDLLVLENDISLNIDKNVVCDVPFTIIAEPGTTRTIKRTNDSAQIEVNSPASITLGRKENSGKLIIDENYLANDGKTFFSNDDSLTITEYVTVINDGQRPSSSNLWARSVDGTNNSRFISTAVDSEGNIYAVGFQKGKDAFDYGNNVIETGGTDNNNAVLVKYNAEGVAQWAKTVTNRTTAQNSVFNSVAIDSDKNIYIAGSQSGTGEYDYGNSIKATATGGSTGFNSVLVKYNEDGVAQWAKIVINGGSDSEFNSVVLDNAENIYAAGYQSGKAEFNYGGIITAAATDGSVGFNSVLVKYDENGDAKWAKTVICNDDGKNSLFNSVAIDSNKNIYAAGYQYGGVEFNYGGNATATAGFTGSNSVLVKYTADGEAQWAKTVTNVGKGSQFNSVALDNDRNIYVAGYQNGTGQYDYGNGQTATATGGSDGSNAVLVKYNLSGEAQWAKTVIGSVSFSRFTSVAVVSYGFGSGIYTVGSQDGKGQYTYGANATATGTASHDNSVLVKYAANGMAQWAKTLTAGDNNSYFYSVALDNTGNIYAAGFQNGTGAYSYGDYQTAAGGFTERNSVLVKYRQQ